jgi:hypothetical protein
VNAPCTTQAICAQRDLGQADGVSPTANTPAIDGWDRVRDALTELHAYVLILDGELERTETQLTHLGPAEPQAGELWALRRRRTDIAVQLELLSRVIVALRAATDPTGRRL